jgi:hypothetical protein
MAFEDFENDYTEQDTPGRLSASTVTITVTDLDADEDSYFYYDYGVNHFGNAENFQHLIEIQYSGDVGAGDNINFWCLSPDDFGSLDDIKNGLGALINLEHYNGTLYTTHYFNDAIVDWDNYTAGEGYAASTRYYVTLDWDFNGGPSSAGQLVAYIRKTSHASSIEDTLTFDADNNYTFRYNSCGGVNSGSSGNSVDGIIANLDLQEAVAVSPTGALYGSLVGPLGGPI